MAAKWTTAWRMTVVIAPEAEMRGHRVEHLAAVGDIGDQRVDPGMVEALQIDIQDLVALIEQPGQRMPSRLAGAAGEENSLGHGSFLS
jgi:hypothetical protein